MTDEVKPTCGQAGGRTKRLKHCNVTMNLSPTNGLCLQHDPERKEELYQVRVAGAKARGKKVQKAKAAQGEVPRKPKNLQDAIEWASWATFAVATGEIDTRVAHEVAVLVREFRMALEKRALEEQVEALKAQLAEANKRGMRVA